MENITFDFNFTFQTNISDADISEAGFSYPYSLTESVVVSVCLVVLITMTIVGNVFVLLAVFLNSHLKNTTNYFIVNLALADLLLGSVVLPFSAVNTIVSFWPFGALFCDVWAATDVLCCTASILSLCAISIDRYLGVTKPLQRSAILTERRAVIINLIIWIVSVIISIPPFFGWKQPPDPIKPWECEVNQQLGYVLFSVSVSFYAPLSVIVILYFRIYQAAVKHTKFLALGTKKSKRRPNVEGVTLRVHTGNTFKHTITDENYRCSNRVRRGKPVDVPDSRKPIFRKNIASKMTTFKRETKAAKTLAIVVGVFILCWFPFFFILPLQALCESCVVPDTLFAVLFWLGYCNSMMNPIIYACSHRELKRAFRRIARCQCRKLPHRFAHEHSFHSHTLRDGNSSPTPLSEYTDSQRYIGKSSIICKRQTGSFRGGCFHPTYPTKAFAREDSSDTLSDPESPIRSLKDWQVNHIPCPSVKRNSVATGHRESPDDSNISTYKFPSRYVECAIPSHSDDEIDGRPKTERIAMNDVSTSTRLSTDKGCTITTGALSPSLHVCNDPSNIKEMKILATL